MGFAGSDEIYLEAVQEGPRSERSEEGLRTMHLIIGLSFVFCIVVTEVHCSSLVSLLWLKPSADEPVQLTSDGSKTTKPQHRVALDLDLHSGSIKY